MCVFVCVCVCVCVVRVGGTSLSQYFYSTKRGLRGGLKGEGMSGSLEFNDVYGKVCVCVCVCVTTVRWLAGVSSVWLRGGGPPPHMLRTGAIGLSSDPQFRPSGPGLRVRGS